MTGRRWPAAPPDRDADEIFDRCVLRLIDGALGEPPPGREAGRPARLTPQEGS